MIEQEITKYILTFCLGIVGAGITLLGKKFFAKIKHRHELESQEKDKAMDKHIDEKIQEQIDPIVEEIELLRAHLISAQDGDKQQIEDINKKLDLIIASYRFRLVQLCKIYMAQGYMTQVQYDQLVEFYKMYEGCGGNGQAKQYYEKTKDLPIKDENE